MLTETDKQYLDNIIRMQDKIIDEFNQGKLKKKDYESLLKTTELMKQDVNKIEKELIETLRNI